MKAAVSAQTLLATDVTGATYGCQYFSWFLFLSCGARFCGTTPEDLCRALKGKAGRAPFLSLVVAGLGMTMAVMFLFDPLLAKARMAFTPSNSSILSLCQPFF